MCPNLRSHECNQEPAVSQPREVVRTDPPTRQATLGPEFTEDPFGGQGPFRGCALVWRLFPAQCTQPPLGVLIFLLSASNQGSFSGFYMSAEPLLEPSPPSFPEDPHSWAGCQNFTLIWCSLGPELLNFLQNRVRKCTIYLITMNS